MDQQKELAQIEQVATWLDGKKSLPFGLDPLLGLTSFIPIPGISSIGDFIPLLASVYMISTGVRLGLPFSKIAQMVVVTVLDVLIGTVPGIGDFADFFIRSHRYNAGVIRKHVMSQS